MATQPIKVPMPLTSEEIRQGIAVRIANAIEGLSEAERTELRDAIWESLGKTCSLNRQSYASFSVEWKMDYISSSASWSIAYTLNDFGRPVTGAISGGFGQFTEDMKEYSGTIEAVPPDRFRRETNQPIPQAQVVKPKQENNLGITRSVGRPRKIRET